MHVAWTKHVTSTWNLLVSNYGINLTLLGKGHSHSKSIYHCYTLEGSCVLNLEDVSLLPSPWPKVSCGPGPWAGLASYPGHEKLGLVLTVCTCVTFSVTFLFRSTWLFKCYYVMVFSKMLYFKREKWRILCKVWTGPGPFAPPLFSSLPKITGCFFAARMQLGKFDLVV